MRELKHVDYDLSAKWKQRERYIKDQDTEMLFKVRDEIDELLLERYALKGK